MATIDEILYGAGAVPVQVEGALWPCQTDGNDDHLWVEREDALDMFSDDEDAADAVWRALQAAEVSHRFTRGHAVVPTISGMHPYIDPIPEA
jgi:isoaspartyl peptidase/L-asparaginase-like protein (Ntn-hydrolase superfamily)